MVMALIPVRTVFADLPAPTPTPTTVPAATATKPDNYFQAQVVSYIPVPNSSEIIDKYVIQPIYHQSLVSLVSGILASLSLTVNPQANKLKETSLEGFSTLFSNGANDLLPHQVKTKIIPATDDRSTKATAYLCIYDGSGALIKNLKSASIFSNNNPDQNPEKIRDYDMAEKLYSSMTARGSVSTDTNGNYSLTRDTLAIATDQPLPCPGTETAIKNLIPASDTVNKTVDSTGTNSFAGNNPLNTLIHFFDDVCDISFTIPLIGKLTVPCTKYPVYYLPSELSPYIVNADYTATGGIAGEADQVGYTVPNSEKNSGGDINTYKPSRVLVNDPTDPKKYNGGDPNQGIDLNGNPLPTGSQSSLRARGRLFDYSKYNVCAIAPHSTQPQVIPKILAGTYDPNNPGRALAEADTNSDVLAAQTQTNCVADIVETSPPVTGSCGGAPISFGPSASCGLCHPEKLASAADSPDTVPASGMPPSLQNLLEKLAEAFHVPAASILAAMYHEGAFTDKVNNSFIGGSYAGADSWTEDNVKKWIQCGVPLPKCPAEKVTHDACSNGAAECGMAVWGTGQIPGVFWSNGELANAVTKIDPSRTADKINPCNLVDSLAATAQELETWSGFPRSPGDCYNYSMTNATFPESCSSSVWKNDTVIQSHIGLWVGHWDYCPDTHHPAPADVPADVASQEDAKYAEKIMNIYNTFKCN